MQQTSRIELSDLTESEPKRHLIQIPLEFDYEPFDIITKELTKLHSNWEYRIIYLGTRWAQSIKVHKALSWSEQDPYVKNSSMYCVGKLQKYSVDMSKTAKSSMFSETVYKNEFYKTAIYYRAFQGMNPTIPEGSQFIFDSFFEGANLDCVVKVNQVCYDLFLRVDSNTRGHTLWYYFSIKNGKKKSISLNICNISKHHNLYQKNMKPYVFSKQKHKKSGQGWIQDGINIAFGPAKLRYDFVYDRCHVKAFSRLSFDYNFQHDNDEVWFAYCVPYTYSYLLKELSQLPQVDQQGFKIVQRTENGRSLMGIPIHVLKITDPTRDDKNKKVIVATGRVHPGQSNGSIVMSGLMKYLCSVEAAELRKHAIFIIVPMMNPDGVVMGNYRTGASGKDLNRVYTRLNKQVYPEIYFMRMLIKKLVEKSPVFMFLDLHGHSSKKNTFFYGPSYPITEPQYYKAKVLPKILSSKTPIFRYYSCVFRLAESKKETARAVMLDTYKIPYVYTVESSNGFYYDPEVKMTYEFNLEKFIELGHYLGVALCDHVSLLTDYEQFINQKRQGATKKRAKRVVQTAQKKVYRQKQIIEEEVYEDQKMPSTTVFFMNLIEEIKNEEKTRKQSQTDEDSDSDNEQEDLQPEKLAQFNKILVKDYEINTVVDSVRNKPILRHQNVRVKQQQQRPIRKSKEDTDFEMDLINQVIDRKQYSAAEKRKYSTSVKEKRQYLNRSAKDYRKQKEKNQKLQEQIIKQPVKYIDPIRVQFNYEALQAPENKSQEQPHDNKPLVITVNRYSDKKLRRQQRLDSAQHLSSNLFDFEVAQYPTGVFTLPMKRLPMENKKKKAMSQTHERARLFSSYGNSRQHSKSNLVVQEPSSGLQFNFSRLLKHPAATPNVANESKLKDYRSFKTVFPSSFYRIKQQIKNRRRQYPFDLDDNALALDIRKVYH